MHKEGIETGVLVRRYTKIRENPSRDKVIRAIRKVGKR